MTDKSDHHDEIAQSDCLEAFDHLYAYIIGELDDIDTLAKIEHHLGHCRSCFSRAEMERQLNDRIKQTKDDQTPETLKNRLKDLMDSF